MQKAVKRSRGYSSSKLKILLLGNFDHHYLSSVALRNDEYSIRYRELYTQCCNQIEELADMSVQAHVLAGLSMLDKGAGSLVAKTPLGNKAQLGEALIDAGKILAVRVGMMPVKPCTLLLKQKMKQCGLS